MEKPQQPSLSSRWAVWGVPGDTPGDKQCLAERVMQPRTWRCTMGFLVYVINLPGIAAAKTERGAPSPALSWEGVTQADRNLPFAHCWEDTAIRLSRKARYHGRALGADSHLPHPQNGVDLVWGRLDGPSSCNYTSRLLCAWKMQHSATTSNAMPCGSTHSLRGCL